MNDKKFVLRINCEKAFLISFILILIRREIFTAINWNNGYKEIAHMISILLFILSFLFALLKIYFDLKKNDLKYCILVVLIISTMIISYYNTGSIELLLLFFYICLGRYVDFDKTVRIYCNVSIICLFVDIILYYLKVSSDVIVSFSYGEGHCFGVSHPNYFAAMVLCIVLSWQYTYNKGEFNFWMLCAFVISAVFVWQISLSRTCTILMIFYPILSAFIKVLIMCNSKWIIRSMQMIIPLLFVGCIGFMMYSNSHSLDVDFGFLYRFKQVYSLYERNGIHLFGTYIQPNMRTIVDTISDSSFVMLILYYGVAPTIIVLFFLYDRFRVFYKNGNYEMIIILLILLLQGIMERYLLRVDFDFIMLGAFSMHKRIAETKRLRN